LFADEVVHLETKSALRIAEQSLRACQLDASADRENIFSVLDRKLPATGPEFPDIFGRRSVEGRADTVIGCKMTNRSIDAIPSA
jgi:hypothetical protein